MKKRKGVRKMKIAIRYYTKTGNTKKLADAIGKALGCKPEEVSVLLTEDIDILFLGSSVYAAGVDEAVKKFILGTPVNIGKIVNFSTAALLPSTYKQVKRLAEKKGIRMSENEFHCRGSFQFMHKGKPDEADCRRAAEFAKSCVAGIEK